METESIEAYMGRFDAQLASYIPPRHAWTPIVVNGLIMLVPIGALLLLNPYETKTQELEELEIRR